MRLADAGTASLLPFLDIFCLFTFPLLLLFIIGRAWPVIDKGGRAPLGPCLIRQRRRYRHVAALVYVRQAYNLTQAILSLRLVTEYNNVKTAILWIVSEQHEVWGRYGMFIGHFGPAMITHQPMWCSALFGSGLALPPIGGYCTPLRHFNIHRLKP